MPRASSSQPTPSLRFEQDYWRTGVQVVYGLDEAGRGTWAGPVAAGAVYLPPDRPDLLTALAGVRDSKQMTERQRGSLVARIRDTALACAVGSASSREIDTLGIVPATRLAMLRALAAAEIPAQALLIDSLPWPQETPPHKAIVKGDAHVLSIAAASILAKVWRDEHMRDLDARYPGYGFARHKGYGTAFHRAMLEKLGPCPEHRMSFAPLRPWAEGQR